MTLACIVTGTLMLVIGGAALVFGAGGGGVGGAIRELAMGVPGGPAIWTSPWLGVAGGAALVLAGFWISRS